MSNKNNNMIKAREMKNDEFYTRLTDIERELKYYDGCFENKIVLCNTDDPTFSQFWTFFHLKFEDLKLKKLICTHYDTEKETYKMEYEGGNDNDIKAGIKTPLIGDGDFRSEECLRVLDESDIVVTNPPFSLFREFIKTLIEHNKKFIVWSNNNAMTYKDIFPLFRENKIWLGQTANKTCAFRVPDGYNYDENLTNKINDGHKYGSVPAISVFTNIDIKKRHEDLFLYRRYDPIKYPKFDDFDVINVNRVTDIPEDYDGVMGVPITFMNNYNPEQFDIVAIRTDKNGKKFWTTVEQENENKNFSNCPFATSIGGMIKNTEGKINGKITYARILIHKKEKGENKNVR